MQPNSIASDAATRGAASFPVRRMAFDLTQAPRYMFDDNPLGSYFWLVLQAMFPDGEQFFIDSVRAMRDQVKDPQLQRDISAFIGQEALHGQAHRKGNETLLAVHGIDLKPIERRTRYLMRLLTRVHSRKQCLAMTAGAEHFTATAARFLLRHPEYVARFTDPEVRRLLMWHALEEREHRAVAYDVYVQVGGGYLTRVSMFVWMLLVTLPIVLPGIVALLLRDGSWRDRVALRRGLGSLFGRRGLLITMGRGLRDYFRRDFHPCDDDQSELEAQWRTELESPRALATA